VHSAQFSGHGGQNKRIPEIQTEHATEKPRPSLSGKWAKTTRGQVQKTPATPFEEKRFF
jgi:hypothetical protein